MSMASLPNQRLLGFHQRPGSQGRACIFPPMKADLRRVPVRRYVDKSAPLYHASRDGCRLRPVREETNYGILFWIDRPRSISLRAKSSIN